MNRVDVAQGKVIFQTGLTGTSFTATSALPAGTYRVWVMAVSTTGKLSPWSIEFNTLTFTITATVPTLHPLDEDHLLTGLLVSDISKTNARDTQVTPPLPPVDRRDQEDVAIDQIMAEFFGELQELAIPFFGCFLQ